jgi:predicted nuclease of predicted toxin-antitoxin system
MKIKLDENIPRRLVDVFAEAGHDVDTVVNQGLAGHPDAAVWQSAQQSGRFFVTQDLDFSDARRFKPGTHQGILLVRLRDPGRQALRERLEDLFRTEEVDAWKGCFVVVTARKTRVVRP